MGAPFPCLEDDGWGDRAICSMIGGLAWEYYALMGMPSSCSCCSRLRYGCRCEWQQLQCNYAAAQNAVRASAEALERCYAINVYPTLDAEREAAAQEEAEERRIARAKKRQFRRKMRVIRRQRDADDAENEKGEQRRQ